MSTQIILVRHGKPLIDPDRPAAAWLFDRDAAGEVEQLGRLISTFDADVVITSAEQKAIATGEVIARQLGVAAHADERLGEQGAGTVPWIEAPVEFRAAVERHFREPGRRVLGDEASMEAATRFARAVDTVRTRGRLPVIVTHGRVMSAYVAQVTETDAWTFWSDLRMPDAFLLDLERRAWRRIGKESNA